MGKIIVGVILLVLVIVAIKKFAVPLSPELSLGAVLGLSISDLLKVFETIIALIIIAGFVLQEVVHQWQALWSGYDNVNGARWEQLGYLFVAVFGSGALYAGFIYLVGRYKVTG